MMSPIAPSRTARMSGGMVGQLSAVTGSPGREACPTGDGQDVEASSFADDEHARSTAGLGAYRRLPGWRFPRDGARTQADPSLRNLQATRSLPCRSEERRVGKEGRSPWS